VAVLHPQRNNLWWTSLYDLQNIANERPPATYRQAGSHTSLRCPTSNTYHSDQRRGMDYSHLESIWNSISCAEMIACISIAPKRSAAKAWASLARVGSVPICLSLPVFYLNARREPNGTVAERLSSHKQFSGWS